MTSRKKTPDILAAVLGDKLKAKTRVKDNGKTLSKPTRKSGKTIMPEDIKKAAFYLSYPAMNDLEEAWDRLRKLAKNNGSELPKALIVELAIRTALEDLKANGDKSRLAQEMAKLYSTPPAPANDFNIAIRADWLRIKR